MLSGRTVEGGIAVGFDPGTLRRIFAQVERVSVHRCSHCMPWRAEMPIDRVWGATEPLVDVWPRFKHYE